MYHFTHVHIYFVHIHTDIIHTNTHTHASVSLPGELLHTHTVYYLPCSFFFPLALGLGPLTTPWVLYRTHRCKYVRTCTVVYSTCMFMYVSFVVVVKIKQPSVHTLHTYTYILTYTYIYMYIYNLFMIDLPVLLLCSIYLYLIYICLEVRMWRCCVL